MWHIAIINRCSNWNELVWWGKADLKMLKATTGFTCSLLLFFFFSILKSPNFPSQRPNSFSAFSLTPGLQLTLQAYFLFPCLPQIFSVFLHLLSSLSPCIFCLSSFTTSQHLHPSPSPLWAAVGLLDSRSPMLSSSRAKPEQRAHWAEQRHNVGRLWQHRRWSHEVAKQLITTAPSSSCTKCACTVLVPLRKVRENEGVCKHAWLSFHSLQRVCTYLRACGRTKSF